MSTAWAHLPNARHIDGIIADFAARPEGWDRAWRAREGAAQEEAWLVTQGPDCKEARALAWIAAGVAARTLLGAAVTDAITALIAWPDSARMLTMTPAALRTLIDITEGDVRHQALLLLPAVAAGYVPTEGD